MRPVQMNNEEPERDEQSSSPARPRGPKRVRRGSNTPTTDGQVPQYIPKVKSCVSCRQQKVCSISIQFKSVAEFGFVDQMRCSERAV